MRVRGGILVGSLVGVGLGGLTSVADHVVGWLGEDGLARADRSAVAQVGEFFSLTLDSGWAWPVAAVLAGWLVARGGGRVAAAALAGSVTLVVGTVIFYGWRAELGDWITGFWLAGSVLFGPVLGAVGALTRRPGWVGVVAVLVAPAGAVVDILWRPVDPTSPLAVPITVLIWVGAVVMAAAGVWRTGKRVSARGDVSVQS